MGQSDHGPSVASLQQSPIMVHPERKILVPAPALKRTPDSSGASDPECRAGRLRRCTAPLPHIDADRRDRLIEKRNRLITTSQEDDVPFVVDSAGQQVLPEQVVTACLSTTFLSGIRRMILPL